MGLEPLRISLYDHERYPCLCSCCGRCEEGVGREREEVGGGRGREGGLSRLLCLNLYYFLSNTVITNPDENMQRRLIRAVHF